eukprot:gene22473-biopygen1178
MMMASPTCIDPLNGTKPPASDPTPRSHTLPSGRSGIHQESATRTHQCPPRHTRCSGPDVYVPGLFTLVKTPGESSAESRSCFRSFVRPPQF